MFWAERKITNAIDQMAISVLIRTMPGKHKAPEVESLVARIRQDGLRIQRRRTIAKDQKIEMTVSEQGQRLAYVPSRCRVET